MCEDYTKAKENRERQFDPQYLVWWHQYESWLKSYPRKKRLPDWAIGNVPSIGKHEARELNGFHEIET